MGHGSSASQTLLETEGFSPLGYLEGARSASSPQDRLRAIRNAARGLREELLSDAPLSFYRSMELIRVPYPARYGLLNATTVPTPLLHIVNRLFIIQFKSQGRLKTLLASPSDIVGGRETPFFKRLGAVLPKGAITNRLLAPVKRDVLAALREAGIAPEQVDYISYDHLHTQDIRQWLGTDGKPGLFPRAKLIVSRQEWASAKGLLPPQQDWYVPNGVAGVDESRVLLIDGDTRIGEGISIVMTPGHTEGNHSFVARTPEGLMVTSENGIGPDAYAPQHSAIPGVRKYVRDTGMEVVLNGNTLERGVDQYLSMILEKEIAGPSRRNPDFPNMVCSSEFDAWWAFPGLKPTFRFGDLRFGAPAT
ncbi:MAG: hypothetical protein GMKNLPBB_00199 [Myxococcota bacterium]|nr:hypothetical protein [Myxococcota bacterium]